MINENINNMIMSALKEKDSIKASVYRLIKNEFLKYTTAKNAKPLDESAEIIILQKMIKQREESIESFKNGNRQDLIAAELAEINIIKEILPEIPTEEDIKTYLSTNYPNGISQKEMGIVIKAVKSALTGVDGKLVSDYVKQIIK